MKVIMYSFILQKQSYKAFFEIKKLTKIVRLS